ncbi:MAG: hypothetical protein JWO88_3648 [Frankiales bacterium]|nr:hypothetical protein [Frankiales bacterium]
MNRWERPWREPELWKAWFAMGLLISLLDLIDRRGGLARAVAGGFAFTTIMFVLVYVLRRRARP